MVLLSGAGISVGSGIPTYRDADGTWLRNTPVQHQDFLKSERARQRYWLRSFKGWPSVSAAIPSPAHHAVTRLEQKGHLAVIVTQNVDRLHQKAGASNVIDLHGRLDEVICLDCRAISSREAIQDRLATLNPQVIEDLRDVSGTLAPDGDADIETALSEQLVVPACLHCGGILKPNVVFFGDNVPRETVQEIYRTIDTANGLLVIGSSLQVFSGYRFCRHAASLEKPIASINPGKTRGDELISVRVQKSVDEVLPFIAETV